MVLYIIHAYTYILLYEKLLGQRSCQLKWMFALILGIARYVAEPVLYLNQLQPLMVYTVLVVYSVCCRSQNSHLENLGYAFITYAVITVFDIMVGSIGGLVAVLANVNGRDLKNIVNFFSRVLFMVLVIKEEKLFLKLAQAKILTIVKIISIVVLILDQLLCIAYSTTNESLIYAMIACFYMATLFTILWLLDHYKMAKIQKMYADDNRQMSQKLHRSKEILPMIASYVSSMDGTQDEGMRKKLEEVCHDYGKELGGMEMCAEFIETTGIDLVNLLLRTKVMECSEQDIELNVFVSTQIAEDMKRMDISDGEITRLLGDLLRNAINAVSKLQNRVILLLIARDENGCVLIRIYDSGIPFPPYILERFGERGNTTWGTGNGLADLMETLRRVHASIEINMDMEPGDVFTKGIYICFDGKDDVEIKKSGCLEQTEAFTAEVVKI